MQLVTHQTGQRWKFAFCLSKVSHDIPPNILDRIKTPVWSSAGEMDIEEAAANTLKDHEKDRSMLVLSFQKESALGGNPGDLIGQASSSCRLLMPQMNRWTSLVEINPFLLTKDNRRSP